MTSSNLTLINSIIDELEKGNSSQAVQLMQQCYLFSEDLPRQLSNFGYRSVHIQELMEIPFKTPQKDLSVQINFRKLLDKLLDKQTERAMLSLTWFNNNLNINILNQKKSSIVTTTNSIKSSIEMFLKTLGTNDRALPYLSTFEIELLIIGLYYLEGLVRIESAYVSDMHGPYAQFAQHSVIEQLTGFGMALSIRGNLNAVLYPSPIAFSYLKVLLKNIPISFDNLLKTTNKDLSSCGFDVNKESTLDKKQFKSDSLEALVESPKTPSFNDEMILVDSTELDQLRELVQILKDMQHNHALFEKNSYKQHRPEHALNISFYIQRLLYIQTFPFEYIAEQQLLENLKQMQSNTQLIQALISLEELGWVIMARYSDYYTKIAPKPFEDLVKNLTVLIEKNKENSHKAALIKQCVLIIANPNFSFEKLAFIFEPHNSRYLEVVIKYDRGAFLWMYGNKEPFFAEYTQFRTRLSYLNKAGRSPCDDIQRKIIERELYTLEVARASSIVKHGTLSLQAICANAIKNSIMEKVYTEQSSLGVESSLGQRAKP